MKDILGWVIGIYVILVIIMVFVVSAGIKYLIGG